MANWDTVANFENNRESDKKHQGCESELDYQDAQAVAQKIGIPLYRVEFIKEYWNNVFEYFLSEYQKIVRLTLIFYVINLLNLILF